MKKDKEWAQEQVNFYRECVGEPWNGYTRGLNVGYRTAETIINQLEEPSEIELSEPSAWKTIAKLYHPNEVYWGNVRDSYLESLEEPEKPMIPQFIADRIEEYKEIQFGISLIFMINRQIDDDVRFSKWLSSDKDNCELVCRSFLDGYTIEKEKLYRVELIKGKYLIYNHKNNQLHNQEPDAYVGDHEQREFTEQEIKNIDERYLAFKEEVTE